MSTIAEGSWDDFGTEKTSTKTTARINLRVYDPVAGAWEQGSRCIEIDLYPVRPGAKIAFELCARFGLTPREEPLFIRADRKHPGCFIEESTKLKDGELWELVP